MAGLRGLSWSECATICQSDQWEAVNAFSFLQGCLSLGFLISMHQ